MRLLAHAVAALLLVVGTCLCSAPAPAGSCETAPAKIDDWEVATPAEAGFDGTALCAIDAHLASVNRPNLHAILVVRRGKLVYDAYAAGNDHNFGVDLGTIAFDATTSHAVHSVTKSVVSLLFGIALDRKLIDGLDVPVLTFFPEYPDLRTPERERIQLRHLLTMTPGYDWNEETSWASDLNTERQMHAAADPYRYVLSRKMVYEPDERWQYNGGTSALLGAVLQKSAGTSLVAFAQEALFDPLQIREVEWVRFANGDASPNAGLRLRPRDMAKIGQLVLDGGQWKGRRIVSAEWIATATEPRFLGWQRMYCGYHWWLGSSKCGGRSWNWIAALGYGGQRIFIVPTLDLVVVTTAGLYRDESQSYYVRSILEDYVLPAACTAAK